ncbi:hypothetical protein FACS1894211_08080 [Clostridia bacterium]|nr:hypothetical protein FACS1894211_08080 [Clostridia bacterium]
MSNLLSAAFSTLSVYDKAPLVLLYLTAGFIGLLLIIGMIVYFSDKTKLAAFTKNALCISFGYAIAAIGLMLFLTFDKMVSKGRFKPALFYPIFSFILLAVVCAAVWLLLSLTKRGALVKFGKLALIVLGGAAVVVTVLYMTVFRTEMLELIRGDGAPDFGVSAEVWSFVWLFVLAAIPVVLYVLFGKKTPDAIATKSVVYAAVAIALGFALSYMRIFSLPQGGSVTFASLLPLMFYSYQFGIRKGLLAGLVYGLLQAVQDPWIVHPAQFILDYPVAFTMIGLTGLFRYLPVFKDNAQLKFVAGAVLALLLRYAAHVVSGVIFFATYGSEFGYGAIAWGFLYNLFVFADGAIAIAAGAAMLSLKSFRAQFLKVGADLDQKFSEKEAAAADMEKE